MNYSNRPIGHFLLVCVFASIALLTQQSVLASTGNKHEGDLSITKDGAILKFQAEGIYLAGGNHLATIKFDDAEPTQPTGNWSESDRDGAAQLQNIHYKDLWAGIDLNYRSSPKGIAESVWHIQANANPDDIRLRYNARLQVMDDGSLLAHYKNGSMRESAPIAWQEINGVRQPINVSFNVINKHDDQETLLGFKLGDYNRAYTVLIDPILEWNTFAGAKSLANDVAVDSAGNIFVTGESQSTWGTPINPHSEGDSDAFVAKYNQSGVLQWTTFMGSGLTTNGNAIALDASDNIYLTGQARGFNEVGWTGTTINPHRSTSHTIGLPATDHFVAKLNAAGVMQWHTFYPGAIFGSGSVQSRDIVVDTAGNSYITGNSLTDFGAPLEGSSGGYIAKINTAGTLEWHTFPGAGVTDLNGIALDATNNIYVTGTAGSWGTPLANSGNSLLAKYSNAGTLTWHTFFGSENRDKAMGITVDSNSDIVITGSSSASFGTPVAPYTENDDPLVAKFNDDGAPIWHTFLGEVNAFGFFTEFGSRVQVDTSGNIYVTGVSQDWGTPIAPYQEFRLNTFVAKLTPLGAVEWNSFQPNSLDNPSFGIGVAIDSDSNVFVASTSTATWGSPITPHSGANRESTLVKICQSCLTISTSAPDGQGYFDPEMAFVTSGASESFEVFSESAYSIENVSGCGGTWSGSNPYITGPVTADCTLTATFSINNFTVSASSDANGTVSPLTQQVDFGDSAQFTVTPAANYTTDAEVGGTCSEGVWEEAIYIVEDIEEACTVSFTHSLKKYRVTLLPEAPQSLIASGGSYSLALQGDDSAITLLGQDSGGLFPIPENVGTATAVAAGEFHSLALRTNGTVAAWGDNEDGQTDVPSDLSGVTKIAGGGLHSLALKDDGSIVGWGASFDGQLDTPSSLTDAIDISAGRYHSLGLSQDGTVFGWGDGQVTPPPGLNDVHSVSAGDSHSLALKNDGTVVAWGSDSSGQASPPSGLVDVVAIAAGGRHSLALKQDGTVVAWGRNSDGQATVPSDLTNVVAIAAGGFHSIALKADGTIVAWGSTDLGPVFIPSSLNLLPFGTENGMVTPALSQYVPFGSTVEFNLSADTDYVAQVNGSCGGSIIGNTYTSDIISAECTVEPSFSFNVAPIITQGEVVNVSMDEDGSPMAFSLVLNATDMNGQIPTWSISMPAANGMASVSGTGLSKEINYTPNLNQTLGDSFVVQISDGVLVDTITVNITINPVDDAPTVINPIPDISANEDDTDITVNLSSVFGDIDSTTITLSSQGNSNPSLVTASVSGTSLTLSLAANQNGSADIIIRATADGKTVDDTFTLTVAPQNDPPTFTSSANLQFIDQALAVAQITASDLDGDTVTFMLVGGEDQALFSLTTGGALAFNNTPDGENPIDANQDNEYLVIVQAFDGEDTTDQLISITLSTEQPDDGSFFIVPLPNGGSVIFEL